MNIYCCSGHRASLGGGFVGTFNAVKGRDLAAGDLTPDGLNEAQRLAREWDAAHPREP